MLCSFDKSTFANVPLQIKRSKIVRKALPETATGVKWAKLCKWISDAGGQMNAKLDYFAMGDCQVRGLGAGSNVYQGDIVVSIPLSVAIKDTDARKPYDGAPWNVSLAVLILQELQKEEHSRWHPYIELLPDEHFTPLLFKEEDIQNLQYEPIICGVRDYQSFAQAAYHCLAEAGVASWPLTTFLWALTLVQSRSLRMSQAGCRVMVPGIDMLNHTVPLCASGHLALGQAVWRAGEEGSGGALMFVADKTVARGEQIMWTYGERSNDDLFTYHGFVLDDNPFDTFVLFPDIESLVQWFLEDSNLVCDVAADDRRALLNGAKRLADDVIASSNLNVSTPAPTGTVWTLLTDLDSAVEMAPSPPPVETSSSRLSNSTTSFSSSQSSTTYNSTTAHRTTEKKPLGITVQTSQSLQTSTSSAKLDPVLKTNKVAASGDKAMGNLQGASCSYPVVRSLSTCRLHTPTWGARGTEGGVAPELVLRGDNKIDVRLIPVLTYLTSELSLELREQSSSETLHVCASTARDSVDQFAVLETAGKMSGSESVATLDRVSWDAKLSRGIHQRPIRAESSLPVSHLGGGESDEALRSKHVLAPYESRPNGQTTQQTFAAAEFGSKKYLAALYLRCKHLLSSFPTSLSEDLKQMSDLDGVNGAQSSNNASLCNALSFRIGKKKLLWRLLDRLCLIMEQSSAASSTH